MSAKVATSIQGFQRIWTSVRASIIDALEQVSAKASQNEEGIFITGHFLGGALTVFQAFLSPLESVHTWRVKERVLTFWRASAWK